MAPTRPAIRVPPRSEISDSDKTDNSATLWYFREIRDSEDELSTMSSSAVTSAAGTIIVALDSTNGGTDTAVGPESIPGPYSVWSIEHPKNDAGTITGAYPLTRRATSPTPSPEPKRRRVERRTSTNDSANDTDELDTDPDADAGTGFDPDDIEMVTVDEDIPGNHSSDDSDEYGPSASDPELPSDDDGALTESDLSYANDDDEYDGFDVFRDDDLEEIETEPL
ncbi:hypothetical protein C8A05DRAFT_35969 [Staphylotrichum tortipilum]|uniref:Uncharacterized protein n=1 Tax=Staphylotrichum tortipilum TaxID=2831512 RepID=A0AAN6MHR9_9PEZI|nr:hypothetical protein C8A05DRAFT_35969 [Staphylotrichum longicolle]